MQLIYVRLAGSADRSATLFPNFVTWTATTNAVFRDSAAQTGGVRNIRFVTDASCNLVIAKAEVSAAAMGNFSTYVSELKAKGFNRSDRKYLTWADANTYCGIGEIYIDDKPATTPGLSTSNYNNGHPGVSGAFARTDNGCWGHVELGRGPRADPRPGRGAAHRPQRHRRLPLPRRVRPHVLRRRRRRHHGPALPGANERLLDCNHDDYFSTSPVAGSYLATHWNVANSAFLAPSDPGATARPRPPRRCRRRRPRRRHVPPTTTTVPPTTTTAATTTTVPPTTTTTTAAHHDHDGRADHAVGAPEPVATRAAVQPGACG